MGKKPLKTTLALFTLGVIALLLTFNINNTTTVSEDTVTLPTPFPIGVDPVNKTITENPSIKEFTTTYLTTNKSKYQISRWLRHADQLLSQIDQYQQLASPSSRVIVILPGERKEQVVNNIKQILNWSSSESEMFSSLVTESLPQLDEGKFFPDRYVVNRNTSPEEMAQKILEKFNNEILLRYTEEVASKVPLKDTLTIASLLQREAYDFEDMRIISGIIWNRKFIDMNLQIDATLQYARGSLAHEPWWPRVVPADKFINSPYNTYQNKGLPPAPIANSSMEAIVAALNPKPTDCIFYFHDARGNFYCTQTYEEHTRLLRVHYGERN